MFQYLNKFRGEAGIATVFELGLLAFRPCPKCNQLDRVYIHSNNHSTNFFDPKSGSHTQGTEGFWSQIKRRLKFVYGSQGELKERRVHENVYRHNFGFNADMQFEERMALFISHIVECYKSN